MIRAAHPSDRVARHTRETVNRRIAAETDASIAWHADHPEEIDDRLAELGQEWDIERSLEANASSLILGGLALGAFVNRKWLILPAAVAGFLLQHALQGWCPPVPLLRQFGFRTQAEIDRERYALKALRGDFDRLGDTQAIPETSEAAIRAVNE